MSKAPPRKWSSNAERQRAYRERQRAREAQQAPKITLTPDERHLVYLLAQQSRNRSPKLLALIAKLEHPSYHTENVPEGQFPIL